MDDHRNPDPPSDFEMTKPRSSVARRTDPWGNPIDAPAVQPLVPVSQNPPRSRAPFVVGIVCAVVISAFIGGGLTWWFSSISGPVSGQAIGSAGADETALDSNSARIARALQYAEMAAFIRSHYALLPSNTSKTWDNLSSEVQRTVGGYAAYVDYWATVESVEVTGLSARSVSTINYTLIVNHGGGRSGGEERWAEIRMGDTGLLLYSTTTVGHWTSEPPAPDAASAPQASVSEPEAEQSVPTTRRRPIIRLGN